MKFGTGLGDLLGQDTAGWLWPETSMLGIRVRVRPDVAGRWLPAGLRIAEPAEATILIADYADSVFGAYQEAGILLHTRLGAIDTLFWAWMVVNHDGALIFGRDSLGVPKKMGALDVTIDGGEIDVSASRHGETLLRITGELGEPDPTPPPLMGEWSTNVSGTVGLSIPRVILFKASEEVVEARRIEVDVVAGVSEADPIHELGIGEVVEARWYKTNFGGGERIPPLPILPVSPTYLLRNWALRCR